MANMTLTMTTAPSSYSTFIPVDFEVHAEAKDIDELWSGTTSTEARRRLQNRLNQRAFRRRQAAEKASRIQVFDLEPAPVPITANDTKELQQNFTSGDILDLTWPTEDPTALTESQTCPVYPWYAPNTDLPISTASWCKPLSTLTTSQPQSSHPLPDTSLESTTITLECTFLPHLHPHDLSRLPTSDCLLTLTYYNVFRALTSNIALLNLSPTLMHTDTYPSPFPTITTTTTTTSTYLTHLPPHLQPTLLQLTTPHHPCFDIFPCPILRNNAILNTHLLPHGKLCMTLAGRNTWFENDHSQRSGLVVWGAPEDAGSWEVTEGFVASWGWLVKGSVMLQESTDRWRGLRGEEAFYFV